MSLDGRLSKLAPMLTAQERAILVLESWKEGRQEDPAWRRAMPGNQAHEFNRLIDLMNGANLSLGPYIALVHEQIDKIELRQAWLVALVLWEEQVQDIDGAVRAATKGLKMDKTAKEHLTAALGRQRLSVKGEPAAPGVRDKIAGALQATLAGCFSDRWQELRACDFVLEEVSEHFNGTDPLRPHNRELLSECHGKLEHLERELDYLGVEIEKPEPDEELMALMRRMTRLS